MYLVTYVNEQLLTSGTQDVRFYHVFCQLYSRRKLEQSHLIKKNPHSSLLLDILFPVRVLKIISQRTFRYRYKHRK